MTALAGVLQSWRERLAPARGKAPSRDAAERRRPVAEAIPVREWISVDPGQPARLSSFDRTLVCVVVALLAHRDRLGDAAGTLRGAFGRSTVARGREAIAPALQDAGERGHSAPPSSGASTRACTAATKTSARCA